MHNKKSRKLPMKRKVFLLQEFLTNYRIPIFQKLSSFEDIDFTLVSGELSNKLKREVFRDFTTTANSFRLIKIPISPERGWQYFVKLLAIFKNMKPDTVITGLFIRPIYVLPLLKRMFGFKLLVWYGGTPYKEDKKIKEEYGCLKKMKGIIPFNVLKWFFSYCDRVLAYSDYAKSYIIKYFNIEADKIIVAPNSPNTDIFFRARRQYAAKPALINDIKNEYAPNGEKIILTLGRLNKIRNITMVLKAFAIIQRNIPKTSLVIIGEGGELNKLRQMAAILNLKNVHFVDAIYDDWEIARYLYIAYLYTGICSLAVKMAMAMNKPIVGVKYGLEVHDVDDGYGGYLIEQEDINSLADRIVELLKDEKKANNMGYYNYRKMKDKINIDKLVEGFRCAILSSN